MKTKITKLPKSLVEIEGEVDKDTFESYFAKALKRVGENIEIPGFRKGKAPENILLANIKESSILEEMAELALFEAYPKAIEESKIDAIGRPNITITKLARNNPLGFKITVAVVPEVTLPDYKELAKKIVSSVTDEEKNTDVTDGELESTILDIRKARAPRVNLSDVEAVKDSEKMPEPELPEFNDEFVKALGPFEGVEDFKTKLKENLKIEKANNQREKTRLKIMESIIEATSVEVPEVFTESEIDKIIYKMESDISNMGLKFEDYLKHINKTKEDLKKDFQPDGEKKAKLALILHEIAKKENIKPDQEEISKEVAHLLAHYKDADPERAQAHVENVLTNERIFQFLEGQAA